MNTYFYAVSSNFIEDGSYLRLSYVTLGYDFTPLLRNTAIKGLRFSITGRNLFLMTKYTGWILRLVREKVVERVVWVLIILLCLVPAVLTSQ